MEANSVHDMNHKIGKTAPKSKMLFWEWTQFQMMQV